MMQFYNQPEISWNHWLFNACFEDSEITELGKFLAPILMDGTFINVPCGYETSNDSYTISTLADYFCVQLYKEIDYDALVLGERLKAPIRKRNYGVTHTDQAEILDFLLHYKRDESIGRQTLYISGLQPKKEYLQDNDYQTSTVIPYLNQLYINIARITHKEDAVILNDPAALVAGINLDAHPTIDPIIALFTLGLSVQKQCKYGKVYVLTRES